MMADNLHRREEDRDQHLMIRLDRLETVVSSLQATSLGLDHKSAMIESEQRHLKELIDAKFLAITQTQATHSAKFESILIKIEKIIMEPAHIPGLQSLLNSLTSVAKEQSENTAAIKELMAWQHRVDGVLLILKFVGAAGLFGAVVAVLRLLKIIP